MSPGDEHVSTWTAEQAKRALEALRFHWGDAYRIDVGDDGQWTAERLDGLGGALTGPGPDDLHTAIVADYELKPVPRDLPGRTGGE